MKRALIVTLLMATPVSAGESTVTRTDDAFSYCVVQANEMRAELLDIILTMADRAIVARQQLETTQKLADRAIAVQDDHVIPIPRQKPANLRTDKCGSKTAHWYKNKAGHAKYRCR